MSYSTKTWITGILAIGWLVIAILRIAEHAHWSVIAVSFAGAIIFGILTYFRIQQDRKR